MRRKDKEISSRDEIDAIIRDAKLCHIAMIADGEPYVVTVNYGYRDGYLYFHSALQGRKIEAIKSNPSVCFTMYSDYEIVQGEPACNCTSKYKSVVGYGKASIITDEQEKKKGLEILMAHYSEAEPVFNEKIMAVAAVVKVKIETISGKKS